MDKKDIMEFWKVNSDFLSDLNISFYNEFERISNKDENYVVIGDDYGTKLCISEKTNAVVSIDVESISIRFINSNIKSFLNFLQIYFTRRLELSNADDEEAIEIVKSIRDNFNMLDSSALNDEDNWWSVILEQTEQGLL